MTPPRGLPPLRQNSVNFSGVRNAEAVKARISEVAVAMLMFSGYEPVPGSLAVNAAAAHPDNVSTAADCRFRYRFNKFGTLLPRHLAIRMRVNADMLPTQVDMPFGFIQTSSQR